MSSLLLPMQTRMTRVALRIPTRVRRLAVAGVLLTMNLVHPLVHGTPIDGGTWDALLAWANNQVLVDPDA